MDAYLPPTGPQQIADIYAQLPVTHRAVLLTRWEECFALISLALHLALPWLLLATGFSAALRDRSALGAAWLFRLGLVSRLVQYLEKQEKRQRDRAQVPLFARLAAWDERLDRWIRSLRVWREWDPCFFRTVFLYALSYALLYRLVRLPLNYAAYRLDSAYGLDHTSVTTWLSEHGRQWLDGIALNTIGAVLLLGLVRFSPRRWPLFLAFLFTGIAFLSLRLPLDSSPDLKPIPTGSRLSQRLHTLTAKAGIPNARIMIDEGDAGKDDSNGASKYAGSTPYVILTRRLINTMPDAQIEATLAHEIGHCVHQDDIRTLLPTAFGVFAAFPLLRWLAERMLKRFGRRWRIQSLADPAALPLLLLCFHLITLVTDPLANAYSRTLEHQADAYGLALTRDRMSMALGFIGYSRQSRTNPDPPAWFVFWHYDHPTDAERVRFALIGQPESLPSRHH